MRMEPRDNVQEKNLRTLVRMDDKFLSLTKCTVCILFAITYT